MSELICRECNGEGTVMTPEWEGDSYRGHTVENCRECHGFGVVSHMKSPRLIKSPHKAKSALNIAIETVTREMDKRRENNE